MARNPNDTAEERLKDDLADLVREGLANETIETQ